MPADRSFEGLYGREWRPVVALGWSLTGSRQVGEELAQDAFLDAYRRWDEVGRLDRPGAWVRRAVANRAVSIHRRRRTEAAGLRLLGGAPPKDAGPIEGDETFWTAVRSLPDRQAICVALHYLEDRSVVDIATVLECSANTVKVHLYRGRLALAQRLGVGASSDASARRAASAETSAFAAEWPTDEPATDPTDEGSR
ncbi:MAG: putative polymerase subfamily sigma factor [Acidimicrobiales bacterium]|nr:putative polymerase subfamily sigma factor [Acidimicrobiales bacterium]